jgi:hypothetical protein
MGLTLTASTLAVTLWHLRQFHLRAGPALARAAGWTWLAVYLAIPVLLGAAFVVEERASRSFPRRVEEPLLPVTRAALAAQASATTLLGIGLVFWSSRFKVVWPWPLTPLTSGAVGAWLLTMAAGSWWALREGDWAPLRTGIPGLLTFLGLIALGAARYPHPLSSARWQDWTFFCLLAVSICGFGYVGWRQEQVRVAR